MKSSNVSGSNNCHPGRPYIDEETGETLYSDARTLSLLELFIVSSLPEDPNFPENTKETLIRDIIGEGVPPRMSEAFLKMIN
jgi:DNA (cytosine-5)-methyltransferase 1